MAIERRVAPERIRALQVMETRVGGQQVFSRRDAAGHAQRADTVHWRKG